jgi:hypothetical protein
LSRGQKYLELSSQAEMNMSLTINRYGLIDTPIHWLCCSPTSSGVVFWTPGEFRGHDHERIPHVPEEEPTCEGEAENFTYSRLERISQHGILRSAISELLIF